MKKLFDRLKSSSRPASSPDDEASGFYSTMFLERAEAAPPEVSWVQRATEIGAEDFDARQGVELFAQCCGAERHAAALPPEELRRLGAFLRYAKVAAGRTLIGQDEHGDYMLIVLEGTVSVDRVQPWGGRARLVEARSGDMLGEMSLVDAGARFSACVTLTPCVLAVLESQSLDRLIRDEPRLALALMTSLSRRLSLRLRQVSARLSALLSRT